MPSVPPFAVSNSPAAKEVLARYVTSHAGLAATRDRLRAELVQLEVYANL
jgi:hypothetical protein